MSSRTNERMGLTKSEICWAAVKAWPLRGNAEVMIALAAHVAHWNYEEAAPMCTSEIVLHSSMKINKIFLQLW
jgi:hypothetical protein